VRELAACRKLLADTVGAAGQPPVDDGLVELAAADCSKMDEDGGITVEVRDREEGSSVLGEHRFFVLEISDSDSKDRPGGRRLVSEAADVGLGEGPFPSEHLAADRPGALATPDHFTDVRQVERHPSDVVERGCHGRQP
jgi:hypothetical protein